jgi:hypothetical protein
MNPRRWQVAFLVCLAVIAVLFCIFLGPSAEGDTPSYIQAMNVLDGAHPSPGFIPNRLLTTLAPLTVIHALSHVFGGPYPGWFLLNLALWFAGCIVFSRLLSRMFGSERVAFLGGLFLAGSYGYLIFGLDYLMDIGGWAFYIFALYFLYGYAQTGAKRDVLWAAAVIGIGGLFKEYAFLGGVALGALVVLRHFWSQKREWRGLAPAGAAVLIMIIPAIIVYAYVYQRFGYTYADWFTFNSGYYSYHSRIIEYVKALGSLMNILALLSLGGLVVLICRWKEIAREQKAFLLAALVSFLPIFFWPAITQRILTITVPFAIMVAAFLFRRYESRWAWFMPALAVYVAATFFMDSFILRAVNLPF